MRKWMLLTLAILGALAGLTCRATAPGRGDRMDLTRPDLEALRARRARFADVEITVDPATVSPRDLAVLPHLVRAAETMGRLFWRQASAVGTDLRREVAARADATGDEAWRVLRDLIDIHAGPWDRLDHDAPFFGNDAKPAGGTFYPPDMTVAEFERWLAAHPGDREAFQSGFTVIRRQGDGLVAVPYAREYRDELAIAADALCRAADATGDAALARYLRLRADAFASNDYFDSDMAWMDLGVGDRGEPSAIDVTIGPYEVYEDKLFNIRTAFEAFVTLTDPVETAKLARLSGMLDALEANLPIDDRHKNFARGTSSPIRVVNVVHTAGDTAAGVQTLAFNLPNDERVRAAKGSKKVMLKNVGEAKFHGILEPIAAVVLAPDLLDDVSFDAYFNFILMHEISHGLGPGFLTLPDGTRTTVNLVLKETYSAIEECKADALGVYNTLHLAGTGVLSADLGARTGATYLAGLFRSVRFGVGEAHGKSNIMQYNFLKAAGAIAHDPATGRFSLDAARFPDAIRALSRRLLEIQALGDLEAARAFIAQYGSMPAEVSAALDRLGHVPVDIRPRYTLGRRLLAQ